CLTMHGCSATEQMVGRPFRSFIHPEDHNPDPGHYRRLLGGALDQYVVENRHVRPDGSVLWCSVTVNPLRGPDGSAAGFISVQEDITARKAQRERGGESARGTLRPGTCG